MIHFRNEFVRRLRPPPSTSLSLRWSVPQRPTVSSRVVSPAPTPFAARERCASSAAAATAVATTSVPPSLSFPTTHSRRRPPPVAPTSVLDAATSEMLAAPPGSLFAFDPERPDQDPGDVAYPTSQRVEWLIRGHASTVPGSLARDDDDDDDDAERGDDDDARTFAREVAEVMESLLRRLEKEGKFYRDEAERFEAERLEAEKSTPVRSEGAFSSEPSSSESKSTPSFSPRAVLDRSTTKDKDNDTAQLRLAPRLPAAGPTVAAYDLLLDVRALAGDVRACRELRGEVLRDDRLVPTSLTHNAVLRAAANAPFLSSSSSSPVTKANCHVLDDETTRRRDEALEAALDAHGELGEAATDGESARNAATYRWLIRVVRRFLPASRSRGNIVCALVTEAIEYERVFDETARRELRMVEDDDDGGRLETHYGRWVKTILEPDEIPQKWRQNAGARRYSGGRGLY